MIGFDPPALLGVSIVGTLLGSVAMFFGWSLAIVYAAMFVAIMAAVIGYARWDERNRP
jgi:hypothetical protein